MTSRKIALGIGIAIVIAIVVLLLQSGIIRTGIPWIKKKPSVSVIAPNHWYVGMIKIEPGKTYVVFLKLLFLDIDMKLSPYRSYIISLDILKRGANPRIRFYCGYLNISTTFKGNITIIRKPIISNAKLIEERLCIYVNETFIKCVTVKPAKTILVNVQCNSFGKCREITNYTYVTITYKSRVIGRLYPYSKCLLNTLPGVTIWNEKLVKGRYAILKISYT